MGCVSSRRDINDLHPNVFQVMNVDQLGNRISPGRLEITETDLVFHQRERQPIMWPLRRLRRYGYEGELFSFESGRRCPTGPGIYAFHCLRAEGLFNLVQANIQVRNVVGEDGIVREFPAIGPIRVNAINDANYLEPVLRTYVPQNIPLVAEGRGNVRRSGSVGSSNGPLSPQGTASPSPPALSASAFLPLAPPPPTEEQMEANASAFSPPKASESNNNKPVILSNYVNSPSALSQDSVESLPPLATNEEDLTPSPPPQASYVNIELGTPGSPLVTSEEDSNYARLEVGSEPQSCHLYMNVVPRTDAPLPAATAAPVMRLPERPCEEPRHVYANLEPSEIEIARSCLPKRLSGGERPPPPLPISVCAHSPLSPTGVSRQVNYIVLDLDKSKKEISAEEQQQVTNVANAAAGTPTLEVPGKAAEGYALIDFNKTVALSHSVNPNVDNDSEGSRKTRHNSTVNDIVLALSFD